MTDGRFYLLLALLLLALAGGASGCIRTRIGEVWLQEGSLAASNIMVVCANHHRQMHYGTLEVQIGETTFEFNSN